MGNGSAIVVGIAGCTKIIGITIDLILVGNLRAVVTKIPDVVGIAIQLVIIFCLDTIITQISDAIIIRIGLVIGF